MLVQPMHNDIKNLNCMSIKVKPTGLYNKYPDLVNELRITLENNSEIKNFCENYNAKVVLSAYGNSMSGLVDSSIRILYDNPAVNKLQNFYDKFIDPINEIRRSASYHSFNVKDAISKTTEILQKIISVDKENLTHPSDSLLFEIKSAEHYIVNSLAYKSKTVKM